MPRFSYTVKDASGKTITGTDEAFDQAGLVARLQQKGYFVVTVEPFSAASHKKSESRTVQRARFTHKKIKLDDLLVLARQLATMLESGVTLLRSLNVIATQVDSQQLSAVLDEVTKDVEHGSSLSASLSKHPKAFNQFWISLVEVGEASGTMPAVLNKLAFYLEQQAAFRSSIVSALIYPAILFCVAAGAVLFFALSVGPKFKDIFDSFEVELPLITTVLLQVFEIIKTKFLMIIIILGAILVLGRKYIRTAAGKRQAERFMLRLPKFGYVYKTIIVERFTSQMAILIGSGVPILYALDVTQRMIGNAICAEIISDIKNDVREGKLLAKPMASSNFFPIMTVQMILIGEETGELSNMLNRVADYYQEYVQTFIKRFSTIFEPIMLVFMGVVIGILVIAMFLPIFSISQFGM